MTPGRQQTAFCSMQFATGGEIVGLVMQIFGVSSVSCYVGWLFVDWCVTQFAGVIPEARNAIVVVLPASTAVAWLPGCRWSGRPV